MERKPKNNRSDPILKAWDGLHERGANGYALNIPMLINVLKGKQLQSKYSLEEAWGFMASSIGGGMVIRAFGELLGFLHFPQVYDFIEKYHVDDVPFGVGMASLIAAVGIQAARKLK